MTDKSLYSPWHLTPNNAVFAAGPSLSAWNQRPEQPLFRKALAATYGHSQLLPIESFKLDAAFWSERIGGGQTPHRVFLSSGTTRAERSASAFSSRGLEDYKEASLKAFWAVLQQFFAAPRQTQGWSLIPPPSEWPTSSLAQMVAWIGEEAPLRYVEAHEVPRTTEPVWLFATAFHLVQWADSGRTCPLPPGSIIIETGGTKGKSRAVSRLELYQLIQTTFDVASNRIISEYGMCEMASQAYDFVTDPNGPELPLSARAFRFPAWVPVHVLDAMGQLQNAGQGSLLVDDAARTDLPWPLRTEDMAFLQSDGSFQLLGRVPYAPLKGCSLLAEEWLAPALSLPVQPGQDLQRYEVAESMLYQRAERLARCFHELLNDPIHLELLSADLGSRQLAQMLLEDLKLSLPLSSAAWVAAAQQSISPETPERWLVIPPSTHSFAALYPLAMASLLGLSLTLRCPRGEALPRYWLEKLGSLANCTLLDRSFRVGEGVMPEVDALMVFGSDATVAKLQQLSSWPIQGFGDFLTGSLMNFNSLKSQASNLWHDVLSLGQLGCMSSRLLLLWGASDSEWEAALSLLEASSGLAPDALALPQSLSLVHASYQWRRNDRIVRQRSDPRQPVLLPGTWSPDSRIEQLLCDRPWALPVLRITAEGEERLGTWLAQQSHLHRLSLCDNSRQHLHLPSHLLCKLGTANAPAWDGKHQGRPLFGWRPNRDAASSARPSGS